MIRPIKQMAEYLSKITSHKITIVGNTIKAKRLIYSRSFTSFQIRYLQNDEVSFKCTGGITLRFNNEQDLICSLGSMASTQDLTK